jgi:hypothetical protein
MNLSKLKQGWIIIAGLAVSTGLSAEQDTAKLISQYLFPKFSNGKVRFKAGSIREAVMNYNLVSEKMVFEQGGKLLDMVSTETMDTIYLQNKKFIPQDKIFLEVVMSGRIPFFIQHKADLMSPGKPAAYGGTSQTTATTSITTLHTSSGTYNMKLPDDFTVRPSPVYWIIVKGKMEKFVNERQFLKAFGSNQPEIRKYINSNKIRFEKTDDVIRLINYCQGL